MIIPPFLKSGDQIAVVSPAGYIQVDLRPALDILENWGLQVNISESVYTRFHQFAGQDHLRKNDLQAALDNPAIKAIIAARGGYGCNRIIDQLDFSLFEQQPKWVIGYSDITVLLSHIQATLGVATIHGQMVKTMLTGTQHSLLSLRNTLFGQLDAIRYPNSNSLNRAGKARGQLVGGNLAILHSIIGTASDMSFENKILFIEDVGEQHYTVDRMLWTLKRANRLHRLAGLIVGSFTDFKDSELTFGQSYQEIIFDKVKEFDFPIAFGFPAGHIDDNMALIMGKSIDLTVDQQHISITYQD